MTSPYLLRDRRSEEEFQLERKKSLLTSLSTRLEVAMKKESKQWAEK